MAYARFPRACSVYYQFRYHCFDRSFTIGCSSTFMSLSALAGAADLPAFARLGVRYHRVLCMVPLPGDLDIRGLCRLARAYHADLDISFVISIAKVWGPGVWENYWHARSSEVSGRRRRYHGMIEWTILVGCLLSVRVRHEVA